MKTLLLLRRRPTKERSGGSGGDQSVALSLSGMLLLKGEGRFVSCKRAWLFRESLGGFRLNFFFNDYGSFVRNVSDLPLSSQSSWATLHR